MKLFKKLAINVHSHVEAMADRFENREAISIAYIREYEKVVAKSKVRLTQIDRDVERLEKETIRLQGETELWADRARRVHNIDEDKALECVARMTQTQKSHLRIQAELKDTQNLRKKIALDVEQILAKLEELKRKHQSLASRQACAEAVQTLQHPDTSFEHDINELFTRWETDVIAHELHSQPCVTPGDQLADEFDEDEQKQSLRKALDEIIATTKDEEE